MQRKLQHGLLLVTTPLVAVTLLACSNEAGGENENVAADAFEPIEERSVEGGLRHHEEGAFEGYTLFSPYLGTSTYLIDMRGEVVHKWESEHAPSGSPYLLEDGRLLRAADTKNARFRGAGTGGRLQILDWDGTVVWDYLLSDEQRMQNHDVEPMSNGNVLVVVWEYKSQEQAIENGRHPDRVGERGFWPSSVLELKPVLPNDAEIVWEWHAWDHLIQDLDASKKNYGDVAAHPERLDINTGGFGEFDSEQEGEALQQLREEMAEIGYIGGDEEEDDATPDSQEMQTPGSGYGSFDSFVDWLHVNAVAYEPELDLIVLSAWSLHEIFVIDHSTTTEEAAGHTGGRYGKGGDILYRWGNPQNYRAGDRGDQQFYAQHDSRWLPGPRILVFNNGGSGRYREEDAEGEGSRQQRWGGPQYSVVDEIVLPFSPDKGFLREPGQAFGPTEPVWTYRAEDPESFHGSFISGAQRLPNGNTLVCDGPHGWLFEVTRDKRIVWDYVIPYAGMTVSEWWSRFGMDDQSMEEGQMGDWEGDMDMDGWDGEMDMEGWDGAMSMENWEGDQSESDLMAPQAAFRATRIAPDHPGLLHLDR